MDVPNHVMARFRRMMNLESPEAESVGPAIPEFVGHYRVGRVLGTGASAVVCEAEDLTLKRRVALKILRPDGGGQAFLSRFHREASLAANLKHPHLITIHEVAMVRQPDGTSLHYIVMDCVPRTLRESVEQSGRPDPKASARLVATIARAIHHAHEKGIIHRDLKPANILMDDEGRPIVTDFGLAKEISDAAALTRSGAAVGTPLYMSPEQVAGRSREIGPATDIYALGAILYELLTGRTPFDGETVGEIYAKILRDPPTDARGLDRTIPAELSAICRKALEKDAAARYGSAEALAQDLDRFLAGQSVVAMKTHLISQIGRAVRRNPGRITVAMVAVLSAAAVPFAIRWAGDRGRGEIQRVEAEWRQRFDRVDHALIGFLRMDGRSRGYTELREQNGALTEDLAKAYPGRVQAQVLRARFLMHLSKNLEASATLDQAARIAPGDPIVLYLKMRIRMFNALDELRAVQTRQVLQEGLSLPPRPSPDPASSGRFRDVEEALLRFRASKDIQPYETALIEGLLALAERRDAEAILLLTRFLEVERGDIFALHARSDALQWTGNPAAALEDLDEILRLFPSPRSYRLRAVARVQNRDYAGALEDLDQAREGRDPNYLFQRGNVLMLLGSHREAVQVYGDLIALQPSATAHLQRAHARLLAGDPEGCAADCEEAIHRGGSPHVAMMMRARARFALNRPEAAMEDLGIVAAEAPGRLRAQALTLMVRQRLDPDAPADALRPLAILCDQAIEADATIAEPYAARACIHYNLARRDLQPEPAVLRRIVDDVQSCRRLFPNNPDDALLGKMLDWATERLKGREE